jgi:hypothetical protein
MPSRPLPAIPFSELAASGTAASAAPIATKLPHRRENAMGQQRKYIPADDVFKKPVEIGATMMYS